MNATPRSRRDFLRLVYAGSLTLGLAACASPGSSQSGASKNANSGPQTLELFDYDSTGSDLWVQADKDFASYFQEQHPNITVKRSTAPFTGFAEKLLTSLASGSKYDVIYGYSAWLPQFVQNHAVRTLDEPLKQDAKISADSFYDFGKETLKGKLYGLAWYVGAQYFMYNKSAVKEAGLSDPKELDAQGKWDYDALKAMASRLTTTKNGNSVFGIDLSFTRIVSTYNAWSRGWGTDVWNGNFTKCTLDSAKNVQLWKYIQGFYSHKWTATPSETSNTDALGSGHVMSTVTGPFYYRQAVQNKVPDKFEIGMTRNPKGPGGQPSVAGVNSYYLGVGDNPNAGWTWYSERSFSDKANKLYLSVGAGRFPVRKDQQPQAQYPWEDVALYTTLRKDMFASRISPKETEFERLYSSTWDQMALKEGSVESLLQQATQQAMQQLQGS